MELKNTIIDATLIEHKKDLDDMIEVFSKLINNLDNDEIHPFQEIVVLMFYYDF